MSETAELLELKNDGSNRIEALWQSENVCCSAPYLDRNASGGECNTRFLPVFYFHIHYNDKGLSVEYIGCSNNTEVSE